MRRVGQQCIACRRSSEPFSTGPSERRSPVLPVALVLNKSLLKKIVIAVVIAAAETVLSGPAKGKVKR